MAPTTWVSSVRAKAVAPLQRVLDALGKAGLECKQSGYS
jgi:hypothetical protein